jgi:hypothetical protein
VDVEQFDRVAKAIGRGNSRRRLLAGLLGVALAAPFARLEADARPKGKRRSQVAAADECKRDGKTCKKNSQCCSNNCARGTGGGSTGHSEGVCAPACQTAADCGDPCAVSCVQGTCTNTPSLGAGAACGTGRVCSGGACTGNGVCTTGDFSNFGCGGAGCGLFASACLTDSEGAFICAGNIDCGTATFGPNGSSDCPPGFICLTGGDGCGGNTCQPICGGAGATRVRAAEADGNGFNVAD